MDRKLRISDAPMFNRVMSDQETCRIFLETVLGIEVERLEYVDAEHQHSPSLLGKAVRMDVFAKGAGTMFDIEMQAAVEPALGRRMRFYQGAMDAT